jgi:hypothetical protein
MLLQGAHSFNPLLIAYLALPSARAIRSYCTGLSHVAGIRFYP